MKSKQQTEEKDEVKKAKKLPKDISQEIVKKVFKNLIITIIVMSYFAVLNLACSKMKTERLVEDMKIFSGTFLIIGIIFLEHSYKQENGQYAIHGMEMIALSAHTLSAMHVITMYKYDFQMYMLTSSYIFAIYFVFKSILIYTKGKKEYLTKFSDISEIIKKEPQKKEAKKRKNQAKT